MFRDNRPFGWLSGGDNSAGYVAGRRGLFVLGRTIQTDVDG
jgi:hypothetical protein